MNMIKVS